MANFLLYEQQGHIVTLTMNEPERRNPLTGNTAVPDFLAAIDRIEDDRSVRAVIITGAGSAFSSGGNIKDMERQSTGELSGMQIRQEYRCGIQKLPLALYNR
jgi:enoyl-CoA hydratase/carnithine racemase